MKTILVVDDDSTVRTLVSVTFSTAQCRLLEAGSPDEARSTALRERPDLVILDANFLEDWKAGAKPAETGQIHQIPVIVNAASSLPGSPEPSALPDVSILKRPFSPLELARLVEQAIGPCWEATR